jgi:hypothetical protein
MSEGTRPVTDTPLGRGGHLLFGVGQRFLLSFSFRSPLVVAQASPVGSAIYAVTMAVTARRAGPAARGDRMLGPGLKPGRAMAIGGGRAGRRAMTRGAGCPAARPTRRRHLSGAGPPCYVSRGVAAPERLGRRPGTGAATTPRPTSRPTATCGRGLDRGPRADTPPQ